MTRQWLYHDDYEAHFHLMCAARCGLENSSSRTCMGWAKFIDRTHTHKHATFSLIKQVRTLLKYSDAFLIRVVSQDLFGLFEDVSFVCELGFLSFFRVNLPLRVCFTHCDMWCTAEIQPTCSLCVHRDLSSIFWIPWSRTSSIRTVKLIKIASGTNVDKNTQNPQNFEGPGNL